jgi:uncharacterized protein (TIGR02099 family)
MVKKSLLWLYRITLLTLWSVIIVLASSVLAMRYVVLPHIDEYKPQIEQRVSAAVGQKVTIAGIRANWDGLNPRLGLRDVQVYDQQGRPALTLNRVFASLSWLSIPLMEPRLSRLVIHEPELTIRREADGTLYVAGIAIGGSGRSGFGDWMLRQAQIDVIDATVLWQDDQRKAPPLTLDKLDLRIVNPAWETLVGHHQFGLRATPSAGASQPIDIRGDVYGKDAGQWQKWQGTVYARLEGTDMAAWRNWVDYPFDLRQGLGAAQLWFDFAEGKPQQLTADVLLRNVVAQPGPHDPEIELKTLSGRLGWNRLADGQKLQAEHVKLVTADGLDMQDGNGSLSRRTVDGKQHVEGELALDAIRLQSLTALAAYARLPEKILQPLKTISPAGQLKQLELSWTSDGNALTAYSIRSDFSGLGMQPYQHLPGFSNLAGSIKADEDGGNVTLNTREAVLDFEQVMRGPIPLDKLDGNVRWRKEGDAMTVSTNGLSLANAHLAGTISGRYLHDGVKGGYLDLKGNLDRADARFAPTYYPLILGEHTLQWLDTAIRTGHSENVSVQVKGRLADFPFVDDKLGLFKVTARVRDGTLVFSNDWPQLEKLDVDLLFQGQRMEITAREGYTLGNRITTAKVSIPALHVADPLLQVVGEAQGTVGTGLDYLNHTPLRDKAGTFTQTLQATGDGKLHLELALPIKRVADTKVKGDYSVVNGRMAGPGLPELTGINGKLEFSEAGLRAQKVSASLYGGPLQFGIASKDGVIRIGAQGRVTDQGLQQVLGANLASNLSGSADWTGAVHIENQHTDIAVRSTLEGLAINLPAPLGKTAAEPRPLLVERKQQSATQDIIQVSLGDALAARLLRTERNGSLQPDRGEIGLNVTPHISDQPGIGLRGTLTRLNLDEWRKLLPSSDNSNGATASGQSAAMPIQRIDLDVAELDAFGRRIHNLKLHADAQNENWRLDVQSREITGSGQWLSQGNGKIVAKLQNLIVPKTANAEDGQAAAEEPAQEAQRYPALDIVAENFELGQKKLGRLEVQASEQRGNWHIEKLRIANPDSVLSGDGEWRNWKRRPNPRLNLSWDIENIGKTLERFGYPGLINAGKAKLSGQLKWLGSPQNFEIPGLAGNLKLEAQDGQILQIKPGVGRLFSVLSLQNLPRRLTFDFRDVFSRGFTFDNISASVDIEDGVMHSDDFSMEGPAALVQIKGQTDLAKETQHLFVRVTPYISDSLSLAALAGGPVVGAAAYITQKLLKDPLNKIAASEYEITGSWDEPVINKDVTAPVAPSPLSNDINK